MDAGGGVFVLIFLVISVSILIIWFFNGSGSTSDKAKLLFGYLALTLIPSVIFYSLSVSGFWVVFMSNLAFVFGLFTLMGGFVLPLIGKKLFHVENT
jgi:hypothetical protein